MHEIFSEIFWMRRKEANALYAFDFMYDTQQACKVRAIGNVLAITVNDLTEKGNFSDTLCGERTNLGDNITNGTTALHAAPERNDAKCAGVRTAIDNRHMRADELSAFVLRENQ